jgi:hypothetical protein
LIWHHAGRHHTRRLRRHNAHLGDNAASKIVALNHAAGGPAFAGVRKCDRNGLAPRVPDAEFGSRSLKRISAVQFPNRIGNV